MKTILKYSTICVAFVMFLAVMGIWRTRIDRLASKIPSHPYVTNTSWDCSSSTDIPLFMYDVIDHIVTKDNLELPNCRQTEMKTNLVYIKTHKCASDTMSAIFRRFALDHHLNVALPNGMRYLLGWPHQMRSFMYRPPHAGNGFNIILDHAIYNRTYMSTLVPENSVYITSIREPGDRLISAISYFSVGKCALMNQDLVESRNRTKITLEFLKNMDHYDTVYKSVENLYSKAKCGCIPNGMSMLKNAVAFDMGFPTGYHIGTADEQQNYVFIINWLQRIHIEFPIVILTNFFAESMVLLKRYMCWPMKSILYKRLNDWKNPKPDYPEAEIAAFRNWTNVDSLLYHMFYKLFQKRIQKLGPDFQRETAEYLIQLNKTLTFCKGNDLRLDVAATQWNQDYIVTRQDCEHINDAQHLRNKLKELYDQSPPQAYKTTLEEASASMLSWC